MINDGIVDISVKEENAIEDFIKRLVNFSEHITLQTDEEICEKITQYSNQLSKNYGKYDLDDVLWRFVRWEKSNTGAVYYSEIETIVVNLDPCLDYSDPINQQKIDSEKLFELISHEWVHFKQNIAIKKSGKDGMHSVSRNIYKNTKYENIKWEQMAFAKQELDWIKRNLKITSPSRILKHLKQNGLSDNWFESKLKQKNPKAYKSILKYAVMFVLRQMARNDLNS